jgi:uncharacterized protein
MIGIIIQVAISWLVVWLYERGNLSCFGLRPTTKRLTDFILFFFITAACAAVGFLLKMGIAKQSWMLNTRLDLLLIAKGGWFVMKSVLFEELIFRGVLLYILIKKMGAAWAIVISATAFGVYHWFSHEAFGNPQQMVIEFLMSGTMGLVLAYGYAKTFSLYVPIAIHLGWNMVQMVVFSGNTIGGQLLVEVMPRPVITISYFSYYLMEGLPLVSCWLINTWLLKRHVQMLHNKG